MELKTYYRLVFTNNQEFFVESELEDISAFLKSIKDIGLFSGNEYIRLQLTEKSDPLYIRSAQLFSVQRARDGIIGSQTKLWKVI